MGRAPGFFDVDERLKRLSDLGDQLEAFTAAVDFEGFRPELEAALAYSDGTKDGRPPFDPVMMFKVLVIQTANTLSDERTEYLINDRLSFMRFLGLGLSDRVPDARTNIIQSIPTPARIRPARRGPEGDRARSRPLGLGRRGRQATDDDPGRRG